MVSPGRRAGEVRSNDKLGGRFDSGRNFLVAPPICSFRSWLLILAASCADLSRRARLQLEPPDNRREQNDALPLDTHPPTSPSCGCSTLPGVFHSWWRHRATNLLGRLRPTKGPRAENSRRPATASESAPKSEWSAHGFFSCARRRLTYELSGFARRGAHGITRQMSGQSPLQRQVRR